MSVARAPCRRLVLAGFVLAGSCVLTWAVQRSSAADTTGVAPPLRYIYNSDAAARVVMSNGWNLIDVGSQWAADRLPPGARGLVWVGDYDNNTCTWEQSDASLKETVTAAAGDPKVFGYLLSDEPNPYACPNAPSQHKARSDLVHSIDGRAETVIVLDSNGFKGRATNDALEQLPRWKGTADSIGLDPYPCYQGSPCDFSWIDRTIAAANAAGFRYWGVVQAFNDSSWRWPTVAELSRMLSQWAASREVGYMTFAWTWAGADLASKPDLLDVFRRFNRTAGACVVPRLVDATLAGARAAIARANCALGRVSARSSVRKRGRVVAQRPAAGTRLPARARVDVVISSGRR